MFLVIFGCYGVLNTHYKCTRLYFRNTRWNSYGFESSTICKYAIIRTPVFIITSFKYSNARIFDLLVKTGAETPQKQENATL